MTYYPGQSFEYSGGYDSEGSWVDGAISDVGSWIGGLFGQAEERDARRMAQNVAAFRAAAAGGMWDAEFLKARTGKFGRISIPVRLPYAVSPSNGNPETPGTLGGWATGPAKRHAEALYARYLEGEPAPVGGADVDPAAVADLYDTARAWGRDRAEALLQQLAEGLYGAIPEEYRSAIERGVRDRIASSAGNTAKASIPWLLGAGLAVAALRARR